MPKGKTKKVQEKQKDNSELITDKVGEIAIHYGFSIIKPPQITNDDINKSKAFREFDHYEDVEEKVAITKWYMEEAKNLDSLPISIHYRKPLKGSTTKKKSSSEIYGFEIIGNNKSTSEALLIKCALAVLDDLGYKDLYVDINTIGDKESVNKFEKELNSHFRKHSHLLPAKSRQEFKKNQYSIIINKSDENKEFLLNAPQPIGSLSETARTHFKEVLESIEAFDTVYKIKSNILSNKHFATYTVFEVRKSPDKKDLSKSDADGELLAYGYRYNYLAKKIGAKKDIPSMGLTIIVKKSAHTTKKIPVKKIKKPRFYLVQLGNTAKLKALNVVEMLRKNKIPVYHSITKDKITGQLNGAEYMKASHVLIIGQKEAIENTIVVRNVSNREQETVHLRDLPTFLKNIDHKAK